jgi:hypothetical protein
MRKLFIAGVVAVMVFAFAAFAASFEVPAHTLAAGAANIETCNDPEVTYRTSNNFDGHWVGGVFLDFDESCEGLQAEVAILQQELGWPNNQLVYAISEDPIDAEGKVEVDFGCDGDVMVEDVHAIQVLVKPVDATAGFNWCA